MQLNNVNQGTYDFYNYYSDKDILEESWVKQAKAARGRICLPKILPAPISSRTAPMQVMLKVNPSPIPIPSKSEGIGLFLDA